MSLRIGYGSKNRSANRSEEIGIIFKGSKVADAPAKKENRKTEEHEKYGCGY